MQNKNEIIGRQIKLIRLQCGKTRKNVAEAVGLSQQQIEKYEKGLCRISLSKLHDISEFVGIDIVSMIPKELRGVLNYEEHNKEIN